MEKDADIEYFNLSEINLGWVIYLRKPPPSSKYLKCKWANFYCENNCHLKEKGYGHPIAVVGVRNLQDGRIEISFVQMTTTPFGGDRAIVYSSPGELEFKDKSHKYFFKANWDEGFISHFHVPHVYTLTVELLSKRFGPFPSNIDHLKGQFPVTGRFFCLKDRFLKTLMNEVHLPALELEELASQRRQSQTGCNQSPYNHSPYNNLSTNLSSPSLHSSSDENSPTSSTTTFTRASDNQTSEASQAQNSDTLDTDEHREIEKSNSHQPTKSEVPASEQPDTVAQPDLPMTWEELRVASFRFIKLPWMSPSKDSVPGA